MATRGSHAINDTHNGQSGVQAGRGRLTMESLAAFEEELHKQSKQAADVVDKDKSAVAHVGKTMDDDFAEVLPDDSLSVIGDNSDGTAMTGAAWMQRAMQVFATPHDFKKSMKTWSSKIYDTPPLNNSDSEKWHKYDAEPDSLSRSLLHPPQAPEIRVDPSVLRNGADSKRATQTAQSACREHSLLSQVAGSQQDTQKHVAQAQTLPSPVQESYQALLRTTQPADAAIPSVPMVNTLPSKPLASIKVSALDVEPIIDRPAAIGSSSFPMLIRIIKGEKGHIDQIRDIYNEEFSKGTQAPGQQPATSQDILRLYYASLQFKLPFLVAISKDQAGEHVLGTGFLQPRPLIGIVEPQDLYCADCSVFVRLKHRNRGIGQEMLQSLLSIVTSHLASESKTSSDGKKADNTKPNDNSEATARALSPCYKFVRDFQVGASEALPPLIHFIIVDVVYGSMGGFAEKKYAQVLTQTFGFKHGNKLDTTIWTKDGPMTVSKMMFYRVCEPFVDRNEMPPPFATPVAAGGPVQPPTAAAESKSVGQVMATVPVRNMSPTRDDARFLPGRLLYDLMLAPATTGGNNSHTGGRAPANKPSTITEFW
ncbi:hypothetical protein SBRCBS47491_002534 [Sporothrix bragantina]|uniref:N-acetyltransferase domain-containing protein n=1 Tax=Sporothrix bragantina TaxID=671064 RepID=A0ABP0B7W9_9PEZI